MDFSGSMPARRVDLYSLAYATVTDSAAVKIGVTIKVGVKNTKNTKNTKSVSHAHGILEFAPDLKMGFLTYVPSNFTDTSSA
jgi:hypothetical protein